jgi:phage-related minor tail protein
MEQFNALFENTEAPDSYFQNIKDSVDDAGDSIDKTFGQQMREKLKTFRDSIKSVQESMADVVVSGIKGMEDALVKFVETGKLNFSDLARSIISQMARIAIQATITKPLTNFFSGLFSKSANGNAFVDGQIQKYAYGGIVNRPTMFPMRNGMGLMGEAGSEAILPLRRGANGKLGVESSGGGSTIINVSVDASGTAVEGNTGQANEFGNVLAAAIQAELINQKRAGGLLSNA